MKDKTITVVIIGFLALVLFGCANPRPNKISDETLVQVIFKYHKVTYNNQIRYEFTVHVPEKDKSYGLYVSKGVYEKIETGVWVKLGELKEKVSLNE